MLRTMAGAAHRTVLVHHEMSTADKEDIVRSVQQTLGRNIGDTSASAGLKIYSANRGDDTGNIGKLKTKKTIIVFETPEDAVNYVEKMKDGPGDARMLPDQIFSHVTAAVSKSSIAHLQRHNLLAGVCTEIENSCGATTHHRIGGNLEISGMFWQVEEARIMIRRSLQLSSDCAQNTDLPDSTSDVEDENKSPTQGHDDILCESNSGNADVIDREPHGLTNSADARQTANTVGDIAGAFTMQEADIVQKEKMLDETKVNMSELSALHSTTTEGSKIEENVVEETAKQEQLLQTNDGSSSTEQPQAMDSRHGNPGTGAKKLGMESEHHIDESALQHSNFTSGQAFTNVRSESLATSDSMGEGTTVTGSGLVVNPDSGPHDVDSETLGIIVQGADTGLGQFQTLSISAQGASNQPDGSEDQPQLPKQHVSASPHGNAEQVSYDNRDQYAVGKGSRETVLTDPGLQSSEDNQSEKDDDATVPSPRSNVYGDTEPEPMEVSQHESDEEATPAPEIHKTTHLSRQEGAEQRLRYQEQLFVDTDYWQYMMQSNVRTRIQKELDTAGVQITDIGKDWIGLSGVDEAAVRQIKKKLEKISQALSFRLHKREVECTSADELKVKHGNCYIIHKTSTLCIVVGPKEKHRDNASPDDAGAGDPQKEKISPDNEGKTLVEHDHPHSMHERKTVTARRPRVSSGYKTRIQKPSEDASIDTSAADARDGKGAKVTEQKHETDSSTEVEMENFSRSQSEKNAPPTKGADYGDVELDDSSKDPSGQTSSETVEGKIASLPISIERLVWAFLEANFSDELTKIMTQHHLNIIETHDEHDTNPLNVMLKFCGPDVETESGVNAFIDLYSDVSSCTRMEHVDTAVDLDSRFLDMLAHKYEVVALKLGNYKYGLIGTIGVSKLGQAKQELQQTSEQALIQHVQLSQDTGPRYSPPTENSAIPRALLPTPADLAIALDTCLGLQTDSGTRILIYQADITKLFAHVVVNAANEHLHHGGGVAYAIAKAAGPELTQQCKDHITYNGPIPVSKFALTTAGHLAAEYVLHAVGPQWPTGFHFTKRKEKEAKQNCLMTLTETFSNIFGFAYNENVPSIAVPAISSGIFGVPKDKVATAMVEALAECVRKYENPRTYKKPIEIHLVDMNTSMLQFIQSEFKTARLRSMSRGDISAVLQRVLRIPGPLKGNAPDRQSSTGRSAGAWHGNPATGQKAAEETKDPPSPSRQPPGQSYPHTGSPPDRSSERHAERPGSHIKGDRRKGQQMTKNESPRSDTSIQPKEYMRQEKDVAPVHQYNKTVPKPTQSHGKPSYAKVAGSVVEGSKGKASGSVATGAEHNQGSSVDPATPGSESEDTCTICQDGFTNKQVLEKCQHAFCKECIQSWFTQKKTCPVCGEVYGIITGSQPPGTMTHYVQYTSSLPGYPGCGVITITYNLPGGTQGPQHPSPGQHYSGIVRYAYLPDNTEGRKVLRLLQKAFDAKLTFTIGTSSTTGRTNQITWNDIHHKTSMTGGTTGFGYPDPTYLDRVQQELASKGIK